MDSGNKAPFAVSLWFAPARRLRSSAAELPVAVVSGNPIGAVDVMKSKCQKPQWTWDGWMHWNEVEGEGKREMGYRDAYLHANVESGLGACWWEPYNTPVHPSPPDQIA